MKKCFVCVQMGCIVIHFVLVVKTLKHGIGTLETLVWKIFQIFKTQWMLSTAASLRLCSTTLHRRNLPCIRPCSLTPDGNWQRIPNLRQLSRLRTFWIRGEWLARCMCTSFPIWKRTWIIKACMETLIIQFRIPNGKSECTWTVQVFLFWFRMFLIRFYCEGSYTSPASRALQLPPRSSPRHWQREHPDGSLQKKKGEI